MAVLPCTMPPWRVANGHLEDRCQAPLVPEGALWMNRAGRLNPNLILEGFVGIDDARLIDDARPIDDPHLRPVDIEKACLLVGGEQLVRCSLGSA